LHFEEEKKMIDKSELLERIERKYGSLDNDGGCYCHGDNGFEWLSVAAIVRLIEMCEDYDEED
jgi:hypothetical protein